MAGSCAERNALATANTMFGPLSDRNLDSHIIWEVAAVWANIDTTIKPCGICRDMLARASHPDSIILSQCEGPSIERFTIEELLPLAGRGINGDVLDELEQLRLSGVSIQDNLSDDSPKLLNCAQEESYHSYIPPVSTQTLSGAALRLESGEILSAPFIATATTRLNSSAISSLVRKTLEKHNKSWPIATHAALFTNGPTLKAPNGSDLQLLQELRSKHNDIEIIFGCKDSQFSAPLDTLLPYAFGRKELAY